VTFSAQEMVNGIGQMPDAVDGAENVRVSQGLGRADCPGHGLAPAAYAEPLVDRDGVVHDRLGSCTEPAGDLLVGIAAGEEPDDFELPAREPIGRRRSRSDSSLRRLAGELFLAGPQRL
jgi:hypothetical protein